MLWSQTGNKFEWQASKGNFTGTARITKPNRVICNINQNGKSVWRKKGSFHIIDGMSMVEETIKAMNDGNSNR